MNNWKVVPLSPGQLKDVNSLDIIEGGLYRRCNTLRGGGGYDLFPRLAYERWGQIPHVDWAFQFVVQLFGCHLDCWYCYVTREGVWGKPVTRTTDELLSAFDSSMLDVFHLMGGSPALYMDQWYEIIGGLTRWPTAVFHSDLLLNEFVYDPEVLCLIAQNNCLYAVDVKGTNQAQFETATRKTYQPDLEAHNLKLLLAARVPFYVTFTGVTDEEAARWIKDHNLPATIDWYIIDLIEYNAQPFVDRVPWGKQ